MKSSAWMLGTLLLTSPVHATDQGRSPVAVLSDRQISGFAFGMYRLQQELERFGWERGRGNVILLTYNEDRGEIEIRSVILPVMYVDASQDACQREIDTIRALANGSSTNTATGVSRFAAMFGPVVQELSTEDQDLLRQIDGMIRIRVSIVFMPPSRKALVYGYYIGPLPQPSDVVSTIACEGGLASGQVRLIR